MNDERISASQVMMLIVISRISLTLVYYGTPKVVRSDVWWQSFPAALMGIAFFWVLRQLWRRFPELTLVQIAQRTAGKLLGRLIGVLYALFFLLILSLNLRLIGEFFIFAFLPRTPILVIMVTLGLLGAWATRSGIEVIGRAGEVVFPLLIGSILLIVGLLIKDVKLQFLLPLRIVKTGPLPHFQDMINVAGRTLEIAWVCLLVPFVTDQSKLFRAAVRAQFWQGLMWVAMGIAIFGILGREIESYYFPFYATARMVNVADFLERVDAVFLGVWLFGMFIRIAMFLWSAATSMAQALGLCDYRPLVMPLSGIAVTYAVAQADTFTELQNYLVPEIFTPFSLVFLLVIPVLLLAVAKVRRLGAAGKQAAKKPGLTS